MSTCAKLLCTRSDAATLAHLQADPDRTLYGLDTRSTAEYRSGHLPGWRCAPGGQLVQATDRFIGTRGARVVLADWDGVRAHATGAWLARLGAWKVLLYQPSASEALEIGDERWQLLRDPALPAAPWIAPQHADALLRSGTAVAFDVDKSLAYGKRHVANAFYAALDRIAEFIPTHAAGKVVVTTSSDGVLAERVVASLCRRGTDARALQGGNAAWFEAGLPTNSGRAGVLTGEDDAWYSGYAEEDAERRHARFREFLDWEVKLAGQLSQAGAQAPFRI